LAVCRYFRELNFHWNLTFHTNGSGRPKAWWQELAKLVTECFFAIDGLEDTNSIYRRNTNWTQIMNSVTSFIGAGGVASWKFLIFEHNQHQIREAADLAKRLGFRNFYAKKTGRFLRSGKVASGTPIYNGAGELVGELRPPTEDSLANPAVLQSAKQYKTEVEYHQYLHDTPIACRAMLNHSIFVNAQGFVFPCCWTSPVYGPPGQNPQRDQVRSLILQNGGFDRISALKRPIEQILNDDLFIKEFPAGWEQGADNRLLVCAKQCGANKVARAQHSDSLI
jgi:hypothetical protein